LIHIKYSNYFLYLAFSSAEFSSAATLARVVGLSALFGSKAFLILNTAQAVPIVQHQSPHLSPVLLVLHTCNDEKTFNFFIASNYTQREQKKTGHKHYYNLAKTISRSSSNMGDGFCCFLNLNLFCIELLPKKEKDPNQGTWMAS
jgi:hypothetical protein